MKYLSVGHLTVYNGAYHKSSSPLHIFPLSYSEIVISEKNWLALILICMLKCSFSSLWRIFTNNCWSGAAKYMYLALMAIEQ